ncbi:hypothetical protein VFJ34_02805, partial [Streptococcus sp. R4]|uniref:hypothetical protein n=1 Tax=Streptococcus TaxID=1301 RepID=UPI002BDD216A
MGSSGSRGDDDNKRAWQSHLDDESASDKPYGQPAAEDIVMSAVLTTAAVPAEDTRVSRREWCAILGGLIGGFMAILDIQIANSSMKVIQGALSATLNDSSWLMTSYFT